MGALQLRKQSEHGQKRQAGCAQQHFQGTRGFTAELGRTRKALARYRKPRKETPDREVKD